MKYFKIQKTGTTSVSVVSETDYDKLVALGQNIEIVEEVDERGMNMVDSVAFATQLEEEATAKSQPNP